MNKDTGTELDNLLKRAILGGSKYRSRIGLKHNSIIRSHCYYLLYSIVDNLRCLDEEREEKDLGKDNKIDKPEQKS